MAAGDALDCEPGAFDGAMLADSLDGILAAGRLVATGSREVRGDGSLVKTDKKNKKFFHILINILILSKRAFRFGCRALGWRAFTFGLRAFGRSSFRF